jgi:hypothetical protein
MSNVQNVFAHSRAAWPNYAAMMPIGATHRSGRVYVAQKWN